MKWFKSGFTRLKDRLILMYSQEIILFFDEAGRIIECSTKAKDELGYGEGIFRISITDIFKKVFHYEENRIKISMKYQNDLQEATAYRKNQTYFPVELRVAVLREDKKYIGICTAVNSSAKNQTERDIQDLKNELNRNELIYSELIAKVAHELRTPLNGIMGFSSNLMETELKPNQLEAVKTINKCSDSMNILINDLTDYTMIANRKLVLEQKEFGFKDFIRHSIDFNMDHIDNKGLKLLLNVAEDIPDRLIGDELRLNKILDILFSNAIKFTAYGQIILDVVKVVQTEYEVELLFMLMDTGIGIDREEMERLFESFSQADNSITRKYGGVGLGLAICKKFIEAMNGTITVDSEKNKGSTFSFTVHLKIPQVSEKENSINPISSKGLEGEQTNSYDISDMDYFIRTLQDITRKENTNTLEASMKDEIQINDLLEQLTICIEMENWEKSEQIACRLKNQISKYQFLDIKDVLCLLFAIRRENHDISFSIINEIRNNTCKEEQ